MSITTPNDKSMKSMISVGLEFTHSIEHGKLFPQKIYWCYKLHIINTSKEVITIVRIISIGEIDIKFENVYVYCTLAPNEIKVIGEERDEKILLKQLISDTVERDKYYSDRGDLIWFPVPFSEKVLIEIKYQVKGEDINSTFIGFFNQTSAIFKEQPQQKSISQSKNTNMSNEANTQTNQGILQQCKDLLKTINGMDIKKISLLVFIFVVIGFAFGEPIKKYIEKQLFPSTTIPKPTTFSVEGRLADQHNNPLKNTKIIVNGKDTRTDTQNGSFSVSGVEIGKNGKIEFVIGKERLLKDSTEYDIIDGKVKLLQTLIIEMEIGDKITPINNFVKERPNEEHYDYRLSADNISTVIVNTKDCGTTIGMGCTVVPSKDLALYNKDNYVLEADFFWEENKPYKCPNAAVGMCMKGENNTYIYFLINREGEAEIHYSNGSSISKHTSKSIQAKEYHLEIIKKGTTFTYYINNEKVADWEMRNSAGFTKATKLYIFVQYKQTVSFKNVKMVESNF
jgi:hypothetical protein